MTHQKKLETTFISNKQLNQKKVFFYLLKGETLT